MTTHARAVACLSQLYPLVLDNAADVAQAVAELATMSASEVMSELKTWKDDASHIMKEWRAVLQKHGFM